MAGQYTFLPWLRRGAANQISQNATSRSRASVNVSITASDGETIAAPIEQTFQLLGPGDVTGIDPDVIIRSEPKNWVTDFEPNYLAFVEFYEEDFPWRFTPRTAQGSGQKKLIPWLTLIVLKADEYERRALPERPLTSIVINVADVASLFPTADELSSWAHVQIARSLGNGTAPDADQLQSTLESQADIGLSRLMAARRLDPNESYQAFLVPTFETGRLAGLGSTFDDEAINGLNLAWDSGTEFPIYHEWTFRTGERGDFEELARRLLPREVDSRVGIREIDIAEPGFGMPALAANSNHSVVGLEGALKAPDTQEMPHTPGDQFLDNVASIVNQPAEAEENGDNDPLVAPPVYCRWHALKNTIDPDRSDAGWLNVLNRDARNRAAAGLGAEVVRNNQEKYMKLAWEQVGEVIAANRRIAQAQLAIGANRKLYDRSLLNFSDENSVLSFASPTLARIKFDDKTLRAQVQTSRITKSLVAGTMRKLARERGPLVRRLRTNFAVLSQRQQANKQPVLSTVIQQANVGKATAHPPIGELEIPTLEKAVEQRGQQKAPTAKEIKLRQARQLRRYSSSIERLNLKLLERQTRKGKPGRFEGAGLDPLKFEQDIKLEKFSLSHPRKKFNPEHSPRVLKKSDIVELNKAYLDFSKLLNVSVKPQKPRTEMPVDKAATVAVETMAPESTFYKKIASIVDFGGRPLDAWSGSLAATGHRRIVPAMACPDIKEPMYKPLAEMGDEYLVPNLNLIPPNTITIMLSNQVFIEAYMAGVNHEFSAELLFREYPTDQRCTAFRQFWSVAGLPNRRNLSKENFANSLKDIEHIHTWGRTTELGQHNPRTTGNDDGKVVLVVRGDLFKRYPNSVVYAQSARKDTATDAHPTQLKLYDENGERAAANPNDPNIHFPLFKAQLLPDLHFIGFDLTLDQVKGSPDLEDPNQFSGLNNAELGKFFVIQEIVGEPRFGLDVSVPSQPSDQRWDNMSWPNVNLSSGPIVDLSKPLNGPISGANPDNIQWGSNAADMATILYQKPAMLAYHGREMLKDL